MVLIVIIGVLNFHPPHFLLEAGRRGGDIGTYALETALAAMLLAAVVASAGIHRDQSWAWLVGAQSLTNALHYEPSVRATLGDLDMVDRQGRSELHYSALEGTADQTRALLEAGQDPNLRDRDGFVPLHLAAQQGNVEVVEVLLEAGATVDAVNKYGNTPLFVAVFNSQGRGDVIQLLRRGRADPRRVNGSGQTPVGLARLIANYDVKQFFDDVE